MFRAFCIFLLLGLALAEDALPEEKGEMLKLTSVPGRFGVYKTEKGELVRVIEASKEIEGKSWPLHYKRSPECELDGRSPHPDSYYPGVDTSRFYPLASTDGRSKLWLPGMERVYYPGMDARSPGWVPGLGYVP